MTLPLAALDCIFQCWSVLEPGLLGFVVFTVFVVPRQPFPVWRSHVLDRLLAFLDFMSSRVQLAHLKAALTLLTSMPLEPHRHGAASRRCMTRR